MNTLLLLVVIAICLVNMVIQITTHRLVVGERLSLLSILKNFFTSPTTFIKSKRP